MMQVTFLGHSGFFVELETVNLLFDWWKGELPVLSNRPLLVFASHRHPDHFDPQIFTLDDGKRDIHFVLGKGIRLDAYHLNKWCVSRETAEKCCEARGGETVDLGDVHVECLPSTDEGVAFLVETAGYTLFHAGDLNWWHWAGKDKGWNRNMEVNFKRYCTPLQGRTLDLALFPLDPRQKEDGFRGAVYLMEMADVRRLIPMHQWEDFAFTDKFLEHYPQFTERTSRVTRNGQVFAFC